MSGLVGMGDRPTNVPVAVASLLLKRASLRRLHLQVLDQSPSLVLHIVQGEEQQPTVTLQQTMPMMKPSYCTFPNTWEASMATMQTPTTSLPMRLILSRPVKRLALWVQRMQNQKTMHQLPHLIRRGASLQLQMAPVIQLQALQIAQLGIIQHRAEQLYQLRIIQHLWESLWFLAHMGRAQPQLWATEITAMMERSWQLRRQCRKHQELCP